MSDIDAVYKAAKALAETKKYAAWRFINPVEKQRKFLNSTALETMFSACTAAGKTEMAAYKWARHLTGEYPTWWEGKRTKRPIHLWVLGLESKEVAEGPQLKLLGTKDIRIKGMLGTGMIPREALIGDPAASRSYVGGADNFRVRHVSGGESTVRFVTAEQGREALQGATIDGLWCDEEPPLDVYVECIARFLRIPDSVGADVTYTPLKGETELYVRFARPKEDERRYRTFINMTLHECEWYAKPPFPADQIELMIAAYPERERRARVLGLPVQGLGMVWSTPEKNLREPNISITEAMKGLEYIWGIDFGISHPFGAALCAWDRERDIFFVLHTFAIEGEPAAVHVARIREIAGDAPVAWPHDGGQRWKGDGERLIDVYKRLGLKTLQWHAQDSAGSNRLMPAIQDIDSAMRLGKFRVCERCREWFEEYRSYHYDKNGQIAAIRDDVLAAARYAYMMRRFAKPAPLGPAFGPPRKREGFSEDRSLIDPWTNRPHQV